MPPVSPNPISMTKFPFSFEMKRDSETATLSPETSAMLIILHWGARRSSRKEPWEAIRQIPWP